MKTQRTKFVWNGLKLGGKIILFGFLTLGLFLTSSSAHAAITASAIQGGTNGNPGVHPGPTLVLNFSGGSAANMVAFYKPNAPGNPTVQHNECPGETSCQVSVQLTDSSKPYPYAVCVRSYSLPYTDSGWNFDNYVEEWGGGPCSNPALYVVNPKVEVNIQGNPGTEQDIDLSLSHNQNLGALSVTGNYRWTPGPGNPTIGTFTSPITINNPLGNQTLTVFVTGNSGNQQTYPFTLDNTPPTVSNFSPAPNGTNWYGPNTLSINANVTDSGSSISQIRYKWYGFSATPPTLNDWNTATPIANLPVTGIQAPPSDGRWGLSIFAMDQAGNWGFANSPGISVSNSYQYDRLSPQVCMQVYRASNGQFLQQICGSGSPAQAFSFPVTVGILAVDANCGSADSSEVALNFSGFPTPSANVGGTSLSPTTQGNLGSGNCQNQPFYQYANLNTSGLYSFTALTSDRSGNSSGSSGFNITLTLPNYKPTAVNATVLSETQVRYNWTPPSPTPLDIQYKLTTANNGIPQGAPTVLPGNPYTYTFSGGANNLAAFKIRGCNTQGNCEDGTSSESNNQSALITRYTFAKAPSNLTAAGVTENSINVTWNSNGNPSYTPFQLSFNTGGSFSPQLPWVSGTGGQLGNLASNTAHTIKVDAFNGDISVCPSPNAQTCPSTAGIQASGSSNQIIVYTKPKAPDSVTWRGSTVNSIDGQIGGCPTGSTCFLRATPEGGNPVDGNASTVSGLAPGKPHQLVACTKDNDTVRKQDVCTEPVSASTKFSAPTGLTWGASQKQATTTDTIPLQLGRDMSQAPTTLCLTYNPGGSSGVALSVSNVQMTGLTANQSHSVSSARLGLSCSPQDFSLSDTFTPNGLNPWTRAEPSDTPSAPEVTNSRIDATFTLPSNAPGTQYELWAYPKSGAFATAPPDEPFPQPPLKASANGGSGSITSGVTNNLSYWIVIRSISGSGDKAFDAYSPVGETGHVKLPKPSISINTAATATTATAFAVVVTRDASDTRAVVSAKISYTYDNEGTVKTESTGDLPVSGDGPYPLSVTVPRANTKYKPVTARVSDDGQLYSDPSLEAVTDAWTKAAGSPNPPIFSSATTTSITATIEYPVTNPDATDYRLDACTTPFDETTGACPGTLGSSLPFKKAPGETSRKATIRGLTKDTSYVIRLYSLSLRPNGSPLFDGWSPQSDVITTPPFDGQLASSIIEFGSTTLKANWRVDIAGSGQLRIQAEQNSAPIGTSETLGLPVGNPPGATILVKELQANTSTKLTLQRDPGTGSWSDVPLSSFTAITNAAEPPVPGASISGSNPAFSVRVIPDFANDLNATDSEYAVEITSGPDKVFVGYLNGAGGLQASLKWQDIAAWTQAALTWNSPTVAATYYARVVVKQKRNQASVFSGYRTVTMPGGPIEVTFPSLSGQPMDDYLFGVAINGNFAVNFSIAMKNDPALFSDKVTVTKSGDPTPLPLTFTYSDNDAQGQHALQITVTGGMQAATAYTVSVQNGLLDNFGFATKDPWSRSFITGIDPAKRTVLMSPHDTERTAVVTVEANTLSGSTIIIPRTKFVNPSRSIVLAQAVIDNVLTVNQGIREAARAEVLFYNSNGNGYSLGSAAKAVRLTLGIPTAAANKAPSGAPSAAGTNGADPSQLTIFLVTTGGLQPVAGAVNNGDGTVTASITQSGLYVLAGAVSVDLSAAYAWPVPYKPSAGHTVINFVGLAADSKVKVYTIMGELVADLSDPTNSGTIQWPVTNLDGDRVASGVYVYQIKNPYSEKRGKLMVIR